MCVCVIPLLYCTFSWQILMPQPILIAPWGPHRFIPSGEGASSSPFGPLNARGCVHEPPCGGPPWPPLLPGPRKRKIRPVSYIPVFVVSELFFSKHFETFRPYTPCIYACHRLWVNFVDVSHLFSRKLRRKGTCACHTFFSEISVTFFSRKFLGHVLRSTPATGSEFFFAFDYFDYGFSPKMIITTLQSSKLLLLLLLRGELRQFFYSLYICEHVLFVLQSIFVVVCTFHTHLV